jgi:DNA-binding MarR family transcriptional regulator
VSRPYKFDWHRRLIEADALTATTKLVALALWDDANADGTNAHSGNRRIATRLGITERAVQGCLERLREAGWVERTARPRSRRRGMADVYRLTVPADIAAADLDDLAAEPAEPADIGGSPERGIT